MRANDAVAGLVLLLFAAAMTAYTLTFPSMPGQRFGPALFPVVIGTGMAISGLILLGHGLARVRHEGWLQGADWLRSPEHVGNLLALLLALVAYILLSDWIGFIPLAFVLSALLMIKLRRGKVLSSCLIAAAATGLIFWVFARLLLVPLPRGLLRSLVW
jgi:putative tricarboxylic transport membrane protein